MYMANAGSDQVCVDCANEKTLPTYIVNNSPSLELYMPASVIAEPQRPARRQNVVSFVHGPGLNIRKPGYGRLEQSSCVF
jgi:hypothetical protein